MARRELYLGVAIGAGLAAAAPFLVPVTLAVLRPLAREVVKQVLVVGERLRVRAAITLESLDDLVAEAREEARATIESRPSREHEPARSEPTTGNGSRTR